MPYITQEERKTINPELKKFLMFMGHMTPGQFVYVMYSMGLWQVAKGGVEKVPIDWTKCNEVMGNFDCVAKEFYRKIVGPYEEQAIKQNGDCQPPRANTYSYVYLDKWINKGFDPFDRPIGAIDVFDTGHNTKRAHEELSEEEF
jgi:hypothetical protein